MSGGPGTPQSPSETRTKAPSVHRDVARSLAERLSETVPDEVKLRAAIGKAGFHAPQVAFLNLHRLKLAPAALPDAYLQRTLEHLLDSADPDLALDHLLQVVEHHFAGLTLSEAFEGEPYRRLIHVLSFSRFLAHRIRQDASLLGAFSMSADDLREEHLRRQALDLVTTSQGKLRRKHLKRWQVDRQLGIAQLDLSESLPAPELFTLTSHLADACIEAALFAVFAELEEQGKSPPPSSAVTVLALGKLGGIELNFSSDVDLILLFDAPQDHLEQAQRFYDEVARLVLKFLSAREVEGHLYRVDYRLRPEGHTGPLTRSVVSAHDYYRRSGRPWERQMLLKARPVAGDLELGEQFCQDVRPFLVGSSLDIKAIEQMKSLRQQMEKRAQPATSGRLEVKSGPGGIRDVEYVVQFEQLLHAAEHPSVLHPNTLQSLQRLVRIHALTTVESSALRRSYLFSRRLENRLQMVDETPVHHLPKDQDSLRRLARSMGFGSAPDPVREFEDHLASSREAARTVYTSLLGGRFSEAEDVEQEIRDLLLQGSSDEERGGGLFARLSFRDPSAAFKSFVGLARPESRFLPARPRNRATLAHLTPMLIRRLLTSPEPDLALYNLARIANRISGSSAFLQTLEAQPSFLDLLVDLGSYSPHLTDTMVRDQGSLDAFVDSLLVEGLGERFRRRRISLDQLERSAQPLLLLNEYKALEQLRIGLRDIQEKANLESTLFSLARLQVHLFRRLLEWCENRALGDRQAANGSFAVLAVGKLGGLEVSYLSDADVLFLAEGSDSCYQLRTRIAQDVIGKAGEMTPLGRLFKVDTRLRPEGNSGALVSTMAGFENYYRSDRAAMFEFQALLKTSYLAGNRNLARRALDVIREQLHTRKFPNMREELLKMRDHLQQSESSTSIKRGEGGLLDAEFLTQYLQLRHLHEHPSILQRGLLRSLGRLRREGLVDPGIAEEVQRAYLFLRRVETRMQLASGTENHDLPEDPGALDLLARRCGFAEEAGGEELRRSVERARTSLRANYLKVLGED